jgi:hypothetical protein
VIPILAGLWAFVGVVALCWLAWSRRHSFRPSRSRQRREADSSARNVDADWIYGDRGERKPRRPRPTAEEGSEAREIVADAERKARDILAEADRVRKEVEAELAAERTDLALKSKRLFEFLANTLEEVERAGANGSSTMTAHDLEELEAMHDQLSDTE